MKRLTLFLYYVYQGCIQNRIPMSKFQKLMHSIVIRRDATKALMMELRIQKGRDPYGDLLVSIKPRYSLFNAELRFWLSNDQYQDCAMTHVRDSGLFGTPNRVSSDLPIWGSYQLNPYTPNVALKYHISYATPRLQGVYKALRNDNIIKQLKEHGPLRIYCN